MSFIYENRVSIYYITNLACIILFTRVASIIMPLPYEIIAVVLFSVVGPILYIQKNIQKLRMHKLKYGIRTLAFVASSMVVIRFILPESERVIWNSVKPFVVPFLAIEFAVLVVLEAAVFFYVMKVSFSALSKSAAISKVEDRTGMPVPVIKLIILEARMWRGLFRKLSGQSRVEADTITKVDEPN